MKVCIIGLGYIGLPTSVILAEHDIDVVGVDIDKERVNSINAGDSVIEEPGLQEKLNAVLKHNCFRATTTISQADYFIIAVPTPFTKDKEADLSYVFDAAEQVATVLKKNDVVILESTVPVGTTQKLAKLLQEKTGLSAGTDFFVCFCPERVLPGNIFSELIKNERIIGGINIESVQRAQHLYKQFVHGELYLTNDSTAEMVKLVENSSRDVQLAFAHNVASMATAAGLNPYKVIELANKHPRVSILHPTCGVGGHCIAIDPWFLIKSFPQQSAVLQAARTVNDDKPQEVIKYVNNEILSWQSHYKKQCTVLLLGLTYKPDVDDLRESPALFIARRLQQSGSCNLLVCEPNIQKKNLEQLNLVSFQEGIEKADIVVCLVGHALFKKYFKTYNLKGKRIVDCCGIFYQMKNENKKQEFVFWPAQSMLDFFIVNQQEIQEEEDNFSKECGL